MRFDPTKPYGRRQEAPLTEEYQKIYQENLEEQARGGQGLFLYHASCLPAGMPTMMSIGTFEYIITPETTYIAAGTDLRRIFTDGRPWPTDLEPTYQGFSIGKWIDEDGDGIYDVLEVETRGPFKGPRVYDSTGIPLHFDNESTFKERIFLDKKDPNILHDVITVFDHALTRPWTVDKTYRRSHEEISELVDDQLPGRHELRHHRQGILSGELGRLSDAHQEGPAAARHPLFPASAEVSGSGRRTVVPRPAT